MICKIAGCNNEAIHDFCWCWKHLFDWIHRRGIFKRKEEKKIGPEK